MTTRGDFEFILSELRVRHAGADHDALSGIDLWLTRGQCLGVVGESGSGKSTLALALMGLLPTTTHVEGRLRLGDAEVDLGRRHDLRAWRGARLGLVFQDALASLHPLRTVRDQLREVVALHVPRARVNERVAALAAEVDLDPTLLDRVPHRLSGGQRQRAGIALALAGDPAVLIADEITSALDPERALAIETLLRGLTRARGLILIAIAHDLAQVERLADRLLVLREGVVVERGDRARVFAAPRAAYTRELLEAARPRERPPTARTRDDVEPVLALRGVEAGYPRARGAVLQALDLRVAPGEIVAILGASGSGKTSLLRVLLGLLHARAGSIALAGRELIGLQGRERRLARRAIGVVFQDPAASLDPRWPVARLIAEPLRLAGETDTAERVRELLDAVGLDPSLATRLPHRLSGGQQQRVAIARALAARPRVLVCDEAVSALDVRIKAQILELLRQLATDRGLAIVFVTHDREAARDLADRVLMLRDGRLSA